MRMVTMKALSSAGSEVHAREWMSKEEIRGATTEFKFEFEFKVEFEMQLTLDLSVNFESQHVDPKSILVYLTLL